MCSSTNSNENTLSAWRTLSGFPLCVDWICGAVLSQGYLLASEKPEPPVSGYTVMCTSELFCFLIKTLFSFLQICSQLSTRLETQQAASREELEVVKVRRSENARCCGFLQIHAVLRQYPRGSPAPRAWPRPRRPGFWRHAHPAPLGGWKADSVSGPVWCSSVPAERLCSHQCQGLSQAGRGSSALSQEAPEHSCSVDAWEPSASRQGQNWCGFGVVCHRAAFSPCSLPVFWRLFLKETVGFLYMLPPGGETPFAAYVRKAIANSRRIHSRANESLFSEAVLAQPALGTCVQKPDVVLFEYIQVWC